MKPRLFVGLPGLHALRLPVLLGLVLSPPALPHHSFSAEFEDRSGEISGIITRVRYGNPHARYQIEVSGPEGTESWELQASNIATLRSAGWDQDFLQIGDEVTATGSLGRNGSRKLFVRGLTKASGEVYPRPETRRDPGLVNASPDKDYGYARLNPDAPFDISGPWRNTYKFRVTVDDLEPKPTPFTEQGRALFTGTEHYDDYALRCVAPGLPRVFGAPFPMDIVDAGSHYQIVYIEHNTPRRIHMDGRRPPEDYPDRPMGYSVGSWEGDELVIETTHLSPGWLDGSGLPYMGGEDTRIVERYTFAPDRLSMDRVMTIYDSYYTQPLVRRRGSARDDDLDLVEHDSCDPASYYHDLLEAGELEQRIEETL